MDKTTIQIQRQTQKRLKGIGTMGDTYDSLINTLIEEHERMKKIDFLVETQQEKARKGAFVELK